MVGSIKPVGRIICSTIDGGLSCFNFGRSAHAVFSSSVRLDLEVNFVSFWVSDLSISNSAGVAETNTAWLIFFSNSSNFKAAVIQSRWQAESCNLSK